MNVSDVVFFEIKLNNRRGKRETFYNVCYREDNPDYNRRDVWIDKSDEKLCKKIFTMVRQSKDQFIWRKIGHTGSLTIMYINKEFINDDSYYSVVKMRNHVSITLHTKDEPKDERAVRGSGTFTVFEADNVDQLFSGFKGLTEADSDLISAILLREEVQGL